MKQISKIEIQDFALWKKLEAKRTLYSFDLDLTGPYLVSRSGDAG